MSVNGRVRAFRQHADRQPTAEDTAA